MIEKFSFSYQNQNYFFNPAEALDISIPLRKGEENVNCYYAEPVQFFTIRSGDFVGSIKEGGPCNYQKMLLTPHGNGTHTECYGHISADEQATVFNCLKKFLFFAQVISIAPEEINGDEIIRLDEIKTRLSAKNPEALIIRTLPNQEDKLTKKYSGTNPPYLEAIIGKYLAERGVKHLLIDLPSVDREADEGKLAAHKLFWQYPVAIRQDCTITELIYVHNSIKDGLYLLNLQVTSLCADASPSKPILYRLYS